MTDWLAVRGLVPEVLGVLVRRYGHFDACEDAVQEALVAAAAQWPVQGWPDNPRAWLVTVASHRLADQLRSDAARRRREEADAIRTPPPPAGGGVSPDLVARGTTGDDTLTLLFLCCHPALTPPSQVALTLRAVGGLSTAEIARAFLVPEATMAQRISRAKQRITAAGAGFDLPPSAEQAERLGVVLHVVYLVFNEGYTATSGAQLVRAELTAEAVRLARELHRLVPDDGEVAGLLGLLLLTDARRPARTTRDGSLAARCSAASPMRNSNFRSPLNNDCCRCNRAAAAAARVPGVDPLHAADDADRDPPRDALSRGRHRRCNCDASQSLLTLVDC